MYTVYTKRFKYSRFGIVHKGKTGLHCCLLEIFGDFIHRIPELDKSIHILFISVRAVTV